MSTKGIRFFQFTDPVLTTWLEIFDTALLFVPMLSQNVSTAAAARNVQFLADYAHITMNNRTAGLVNIDPTTIQSGDFFGVIRLDGLDPMLAWAMGSSTGHTTVALWDDDGQLYIHESTANDSYWPTNGIQRTPWAQWIKQANEASYNVVHAPLSKAVAAKFNRTAALEFFATVEGLNYGYHNMLWGWIDTVSDNYPCTPPDFSSKCLQWELVETLFAVLDKLVPSLGDLFFVQAWNLRLGTQNLPPADLYMVANKTGIHSSVIPTIVEQDSWNYQTTRYGKPAVGKSMVCCVFVCSVWKAGGVFGDDEENCTEFTNWDDYSMNIFDASGERPAACVTADPNNQLCQVMGAYDLILNNYNTRAYYPHMSEHCPTEAPNYPRVAGC